MPGPNISSFPLVDFAARTASARSVDVKLVDKFAGAAATADIKEHLQKVQIHLREVELEGEFVGDQPVKTVAFTMENEATSGLKRESLYQW